jgi:hypothetical protein
MLCPLSYWGAFLKESIEGGAQKFSVETTNLADIRSLEPGSPNPRKPSPTRRKLMRQAGLSGVEASKGASWIQERGNSSVSNLEGTIDEIPVVFLELAELARVPERAAPLYGRLGLNASLGRQHLLVGQRQPGRGYRLWGVGLCSRCHRKFDARSASTEPHNVVDARFRSSPPSRSVRSVPPTLIEPRTTIPLAARPPARVPQPAARLMRDRGRAGALPLVAVKAAGPLRFAPARGDSHHPKFCEPALAGSTLPSCSTPDLRGR